ncbi:hypothetical protein CC99x_005960 [Candidatus Berkiella cookevillensis]|uniref:Uncharacterized protein n=1 Tax=Candidatus Berkiella cookevillensis TaxID=437022 RepID=A0A0Q9YH78_9GAMM|nr:hypothetical protein [Candidatus Berkiella cookevillensis]MCS5708449.1 hypothetical protein [Candidatus Berkiella cookevillensis]
MFNNWFYKNVTESALTYIPSNFENIPESGVIEYAIKKLNDTAAEVTQPGCPAQIVDCTDLNVAHKISYAVDNCVSMTLQCGHEVKQVFSMDEVMTLPSSLSKVAQEGLGDLMHVTTQYGDQLSQAWLEWQSTAMNRLPDADIVTNTAKSFFESINPVNLYQQSIHILSTHFDDTSRMNGSTTGTNTIKSIFDAINPVNLYQQHASGWGDYIGGFFRSSTPEITAIPLQEESTESLLNPANLASKLINFASSYFEEAAPEKIACAWDDFSCHQDALSEAMQACSNEEKLGYLQCALSTLQQYASEYDINEVFEDIQENYLPSAAVTCTVIAAVSGVVIAAAAIRKYNRQKGK